MIQFRVIWRNPFEHRSIVQQHVFVVTERKKHIKTKVIKFITLVFFFNKIQKKILLKTAIDEILMYRLRYRCFCVKIPFPQPIMCQSVQPTTCKSTIYKNESIFLSLRPQNMMNKYLMTWLNILNRMALLRIKRKNRCKREIKMKQNCA